MATRFCESGRVRVNGDVVKKAHYKLTAGDVLTFAKGDDVRVIRVVELGTRRGPAVEAKGLYEDLAPPEPRAAKSDELANRLRTGSVAERERGAGRPTKADRRAVDRLRPDAGEA